MFFKKSAFSVLCLLALLGLSSPGFANPPTDEGHWQMTFHDEFKEPTLNTKVWATTYPPEYPHGTRTNASNREMQWYVDKDAFHVEKGILRIEAKQHQGTEPGYDYSSGLISTASSFQQQYGYFEARMKVPGGSGTWPAFRLLPAQDSPIPDLPEIDIMETFGPNIGVAFHTYVFPGKNNDMKKVLHYSQHENFSKDYHLYGVYWDADVIRWYVDNFPVYETKLGITKQPMILVLNLALNADVKNNSSLNKGVPEELLIDYVRAYQKK